jgi:hypothetical protein
LEYLQRLILGNHHFGDDWRLEAVGRDAEELVIFTTQTTVVGEAADPEEVREYMEKRKTPTPAARQRVYRAIPTVLGFTDTQKTGQPRLQCLAGPGR